MTAGSSPQGVASPQGVVERDLMVRARDGVGLATDVYRPSGAGRFPVLLERTLTANRAEPLRAHRRHRRAPLARRGVNPNSGEPEGAMEQPRIAINRVFVDRERPSHLILPVIA